MALFNLFGKKKKKSGTTSHSAYYLRENMIHNVRDLLSAVQPIMDDRYQSWESKQSLSFNAMLFAEITEKNLEKQLGEAVFIYDNSVSVPGHKVIFFRDEVEYFRFLIQFHFIDGQFFFISNKISTSGVLSESNKTKIAKKVFNKFIDDKSPDALNSFNIAIKDPQENFIYTKDDVYFYVNYILGGTKLQDIILRYSNLEPDTNDKKDFSNTLDKYI